MELEISVSVMLTKKKKKNDGWSVKQGQVKGR